MEKINIKYVPWNLANNYGNGEIELNENLNKPEFSELKKSILDHELLHNKTKDFKGNLIVDFGEHKVSNYLLLKFLIKHPKSLTQFLPIIYHKKYGIRYDTSLIIIYLISFIILGILYFFIK